MNLEGRRGFTVADQKTRRQQCSVNLVNRLQLSQSLEDTQGWDHIFNKSLLPFSFKNCAYQHLNLLST